MALVWPSPRQSTSRGRGLTKQRTSSTREGGSRPGVGGDQPGNGLVRLGKGGSHPSNGVVHTDDALRSHVARLDHVYTRGFPHATSQVLEDNTTDHHPVLTTIQSGGGHKHLIKLNCRHFKAIRRDELESALSQRNWSGINAIKDVEEVHKFVVNSIIAALDVVAP
jgi:hypothetical protein